MMLEFMSSALSTIFSGVTCRVTSDGLPANGVPKIVHMRLRIFTLVDKGLSIVLSESVAQW